MKRSKNVPLTYDARSVDTKVWNNKRKRRVIIDLCWLFMVIKVREITKENWKDVYRRIHFYEQLLGAQWTKPCRHKKTIEKYIAKNYKGEDEERERTVWKTCPGHTVDGISVSNGKKGSIPVPYTPELIRDAIGYSTNVAHESDAKFRNHMWTIYVRETDIDLA
jgi:hypothetical protein